MLLRIEPLQDDFKITPSNRRLSAPLNEACTCNAVPPRKRRSQSLKNTGIGVGARICVVDLTPELNVANIRWYDFYPKKKEKPTPSYPRPAPLGRCKN